MTFPVDELLRWFAINKRVLPWRETTDIYAVWVSEIMLQQTQVNTVIPYYNRFLERFPTVRHLSEGTEQDVLKLWEGLGYYSRVRNLYKAAQKVVEVYGGKIPDSPGDFEKLPGVGPYVKAAVLSITRNVPLPAVDGNVMRVYTRFRGIPDDIRKTATRNLIFNELKEIIPSQTPGDFNQAMMELGALVCTPQTAHCSRCPLKKQCTAFDTYTVDRYPYKSPGRKVPEYRVSVGIILKGHTLYIQKRPSEGHLGGLWEFPGGKSQQGETPEQTLYRECREELNHDVEIIGTLPVVRHAYSHFKIEMHPFICRFTDKGGDVDPPGDRPFRWITVDEIEAFPFPGANHKFFPHLKSFIETNVDN